MNGQQYPSQPNGNQQYGLPPVSKLDTSQHGCANHEQRPPPQQYPPQNASASSWQQPPPQQAYSTPENSIDVLNSDIANLITVSKADFAQNPWDGSIQTRLKALLDLQTILQSQKLPPDQIALIKTQVAQLSEASKASKAPPKPATPVAAAPTQPPQQNSLSSILGPSALAALLARQSATPQPTPPAQTRSPQPGTSQLPFNAPPTSAASATAVPDPSSLLERLRASGLLPGAPAASTPTPASSLPANMSSGFPPPFINTPPQSTRTPLGEIPNDVVLKPASLKM
jgi:pre-mRNA cleavage complex 2 protein Pcf11